MMGRLSPTERRQYFYSELITGLHAAKEIRLLGLGRLFRQRMLTELRAGNAASTVATCWYTLPKREHGLEEQRNSRTAGTGRPSVQSPP